MALHHNRKMDQNALSINLDDSGFFLQPATIANIDALFDWFRNREEFVSWAGPRLDYPSSSEELLESLNQVGYQSFSLLNHKHQLVAFGQIQLLPKSLHLGRLAVNPEFRGQNLSYKLLNHLIYKASSLALFSQVSLFVYANNVIAVNAYETFGFTQEAWPNAIPQMEDCFYMTMPYSIPEPTAAL